MSEALDLEQAFLALSGAGRADILAGAHFGERLGKAPADMAYLVGVYPFDADWPHWEMHPKGHEVLFFLEGRIEMTLEEAGERRTVEVGPGSTLVVPPGAWHIAKVIEPGRMLGITFGEGTEHRPR
jgi:mannose-6-phosphate isomerase-like protein (cupin superfamily)